jgi:hypothetical protein
LRAADIRGPHPRWEDYLTGPADCRALQRIRGIGPARAALLLRVYGSIEAFLLADADDVARQTRGLVSPRLARLLRERCLVAGLHTDWTRLHQAHFETNRPAHDDPLLTRLRSLLRASSETAPGRRWLPRVPRGWNGPPGGVDTT